MKKIKLLLSKFDIDMNDLYVLAGIGLFVWGVWEIYPPVAKILLGAGLVWWGITGSRKTRSK